MLRNRFVTLVLLVCVTVSVVTCSVRFGFQLAFADASTTYSHASKPMEFYFHYVDAPVHVAGLDSKYIMNTTQAFRFLTQVEAYGNSFYKPIGQPKIAVGFYLFPNLAESVTINGSWQFFVWVNASAYKPAGFDLQFKEIDVGGTTIWDSGPQSPVVTSSLGGYIDVPVLNYNLTVALSHAFSSGTTLLAEVTVNAGSSADTRIWYDSPYFPSKAILPLEDYARPVSVNTFDAHHTETKAYSVFWNESQRKVIVQANVTDPLGGYDVSMVNMTIVNPAGQKVFDSTNMTRTTDGLWETRYFSIYEASWSYPDSAMPGNYSIMVSVVDNNGKYRKLSAGSFEPFIEYGYNIFAIGVQHSVLVNVQDAHNESLANADVQAVSDGIVLAEGLTNVSGWWRTNLWEGYYNITVFSQGTEVARRSIQVMNASQLIIRCNVYYPVFKIVDDMSQALSEAEVYIASPNGTISIPPFFTDTSGSINLTQTPGGDYAFMIMWKGVEVYDSTFFVNSDGPYTLKTRVFQLVVNVLGSDGQLVDGAYVIVYTRSGVGYGLELSDSSGKAVFRLPEGTYRIDVRFSTVYWLSAVTANSTEPSVVMDSSRSINVILEGFPPPIWTTIQFWLITGVLLVIALAIVVYLLKKRKSK